MTCSQCGEKFDASEIIEHLYTAHGIHQEWETWPDGTVVLLDYTLEPEDFA